MSGEDGSVAKSEGSWEGSLAGEYGGGGAREHKAATLRGSGVLYGFITQEQFPELGFSNLQVFEKRTTG